MQRKRTRYHYDVIKERLYHPDIGHYTSYGLVVSWKTAHPVRKCRKLSDISTTLCKVWKMADRFNRANLPAIHLRDVVENLL